MIVNPDVEFSPGSIDRMIEAAHRHPRAGAVGPKIVEPDGSVYPSAREVPEVISGIGHALLGRFGRITPGQRSIDVALTLTVNARQVGCLVPAC